MRQKFKEAFLSYGFGVLNTFGNIVPVALMAGAYAAALLLLPPPYSFWIPLAIVALVFLPGMAMIALIFAVFAQTAINHPRH